MDGHEMNKVESAIKKFRADPENERLFLEAQAELRLTEQMTELRLQAGLTQKELAQRLAVSQAYVAKLEGGAYDKCGIGTLRGIALALGFEIDFTAMFVRQHRGYAATRSDVPTITLRASSSTDRSIAANVIDFQAAQRQKVAAVG